MNHVKMKYLDLLHPSHVATNHAVLQHRDGVTLTANFLDLFTCAITKGRKALIESIQRIVSSLK